MILPGIHGLWASFSTCAELSFKRHMLNEMFMMLTGENLHAFKEPQAL